jgi:hypothetical protein
MKPPSPTATEYQRVSRLVFLAIQALHVENAQRPVGNIFANVADATIGGTLNGVGSLVGLSNNFSTRFRISLIDFEVTSVIENFGFVTTVDPYYQRPTTVSLVHFSVLPEANTAVLLGLGLFGLGITRSRRR